MREMRIQCAVMLAMFLCACESERTVYDEYGNVVDTKAKSGGERDFSEYMEEKFNTSFSEKKNDQGVPQAVSNRVSSYQAKLDESKRLDKTYMTGEYGGTMGSPMQGMNFSDSGKAFDTGRAYSDAEGKRISKELHPDFATETKGVYGVGDISVDAGKRSVHQGEVSSMTGEFPTNPSHYSRSTQSGYFESRRDHTPPPPVYTRDEYTRKTIRDTRSMLGRDEKE